MSAEENGELRGNFTSKLNIVSLGKGLLVGYIMVFLIFVVLAYIISLMKFPENYVTGAVIIANIISVIIAGSISASAVNTKGWLNGALTGCIYYVILFLISSMVVRNYHFGLAALSTMITCILAGSFGGMIGINIKKPSRHKYKRA